MTKSDYDNKLISIIYLFLCSELLRVLLITNILPDLLNARLCFLYIQAHTQKSIFQNSYKDGLPFPIVYKGVK